MVSWLNHVDKAFIFKSQCELCHLFSVCCYIQNLLGNKINCIKKCQGLFFLLHCIQHFVAEQGFNSIIPKKKIIKVINFKL